MAWFSKGTLAELVRLQLRCAYTWQLNWIQKVWKKSQIHIKHIQDKIFLISQTDQAADCFASDSIHAECVEGLIRWLLLLLAKHQKQTDDWCSSPSFLRCWFVHNARKTSFQITQLKSKLNKGGTCESVSPQSTPEWPGCWPSGLVKITVISLAQRWVVVERIHSDPDYRQSLVAET